MEDADIEEAATLAAAGSYKNSGQRCTAVKRMIVHEAVADKFVELLLAKTQAVKYGDRLDLAPMMGRWMANAGRDVFDGADALVPVPLHWRRQWARRFNQSALLAEVIAEADLPPVSRNAPCPCGSGLKYKHCHGQLA